jgi:glycosyltransferase involved in cell wall biosynthesis
VPPSTPAITPPESGLRAPQEPARAGEPAPQTGGPRVPALSYFFPAHDEAENIEALVAEALAELPAMAERFEVICVDDGSQDGTTAIADRLAQEHPGLVRVVHHPVNLGYGAAVRSGLAAAAFPLICFTDGDRQFRIRDLATLLARLEDEASPAGRADVVAGYRIRRADPFVRLAYARVYRACLRLFFGLAVHDPDCACKLFRREALQAVRVESGGAFLSAELLIKIGARGGRIVEQGVRHYPRTAGRASGANPRVVARAVRDFWMLRLRLWADREAALRRGTAVLADEPGAPGTSEPPAGSGPEDAPAS